MNDVQQAIAEWKQLYLKSCPICGSTNFTTDCLVCMPIMRDGKLDRKGNVFPVAPLVCLSCGYTVLVSATMLKLARPIDPPKRDK